MAGDDGLFFSDSKDHALLAYIIKSYENRVGSNKSGLGRTQIQKIPFILSSIGIPFSFSFKLYLYGPYSQGITFAIDELIADDVLKDVSKETKYSIFRTSQNIDLLINKYSGLLNEYFSAIDKVVEIFSKFPSSWLELFTTLHFIYLAESAKTHPNLVSSEKLLSSFKLEKKDKFPDNEITEMIVTLNKIGFIKTSDH